MNGPTDPAYLETKKIKLGKASLTFPFSDLAGWANSEFGVVVLNAYYDLVKVGPRLNVILEFENDRVKFDRKLFDYDPIKQKLFSDKFRELVKFKPCDVYAGKDYRTDNLFVIFSSFDSVAKTEANMRITLEEINSLISRISYPDLWNISRYGSGIWFFLYTDEQVEKCRYNGMSEKFAHMYLDVLKQYDEFDYFEKSSFSVYLDSKVNFDKNFASNWSFYHR